MSKWVIHIRALLVWASDHGVWTNVGDTVILVGDVKVGDARKSPYGVWASDHDVWINVGDTVMLVLERGEESKLVGSLK